ncbi:MAG: copper transporter, partial [Pseudonocardiales bacterium]|nr:copper transporter [Pseudonocardiales bacterium]
MISLRYHALSIGAVFLALAVGVVLGASGVSDRLLSAVSAQRDDLGEQVLALTGERDDLAATVRASDEFARRVGPAAVAGRLTGQSVVLVTAGADPADRDAVATLIGQAGGTVAGEVALTPAVGDPARADQLRELTAGLLPAGAQLPAAADTGSLVGGLLGGALLTGADPAAAAGVLTGLTTGGFVVPGEVPAPAGLVLVLTGGALEGVDAA